MSIGSASPGTRRTPAAVLGIKGIFPYTDLWYVYGFLALVVIFLARLRTLTHGAGL